MRNTVTANIYRTVAQGAEERYAFRSGGEESFL